MYVLFRYCNIKTLCKTMFFKYLKISIIKNLNHKKLNLLLSLLKHFYKDVFFYLKKSQSNNLNLAFL